MFNMIIVEKREKIKRFIGFVIFAACVWWTFSGITYLFRNASFERTHIIGLKAEESPIDVVYIGGSAAHRYFQPLKAWNDFHFTSWMYSNSNMQAEGIKYYIEESRKSKEAQLYVVDLRPFQYYGDSYFEPYREQGLRNGADSMDIGINRLCYVHQAMNNMNKTYEERVPFYIDICKYHSNYEALKTPANWMYIHNKSENLPYKGYETLLTYTPFDEPSDFYTEEKNPLEPEAQAILEDLINYASDEEIEILFVVCPYVITRNDEMLYNTMCDYITNSGMGYLDTNLYYEEMGLNFETDFYDKFHVNCLGAEKYTEFLARYIVDNYIIENKMKQSQIDKWNSEYEVFAAQEQNNREMLLKAISEDPESVRTPQ